MRVIRGQNETINRRIREAQNTGPKDIITKSAFIVNGVLRLILLPINLILVPPFTLVLGLLSMITFGLLLMVLNFPWFIFLGLIIGTSWLWIKVSVTRIIVFLPGVLIVIVSDFYVSLMPDMGEKYAKLFKLGLCESWPYSLLVYQSSLTIEQPEE